MVVPFLYHHPLYSELKSCFPRYTSPVSNIEKHNWIRKNLFNSALSLAGCHRPLSFDRKNIRLRLKKSNIAGTRMAIPGIATKLTRECAVGNQVEKLTFICSGDTPRPIKPPMSTAPPRYAMDELNLPRGALQRKARFPPDKGHHDAVQKKPRAGLVTRFSPTYTRVVVHEPWSSVIFI